MQFHIENMTCGGCAKWRGRTGALPRTPGYLNEEELPSAPERAQVVFCPQEAAPRATAPAEDRPQPSRRAARPSSGSKRIDSPQPQVSVTFGFTKRKPLSSRPVR